MTTNSKAKPLKLCHLQSTTTKSYVRYLCCRFTLYFFLASIAKIHQIQYDLKKKMISFQNGNISKLCNLSCSLQKPVCCHPRSGLQALQRKNELRGVIMARAQEVLTPVGLKGKSLCSGTCCLWHLQEVVLPWQIMIRLIHRFFERFYPSIQPQE